MSRIYVDVNFDTHHTHKHIRSSSHDSPPDISLTHTALYYSMALINESLEARSEKDASKVDMNVKNISPWVVSALNHIAAESQPPHRRDHSVIKLRDDILSGASDEAVSNSLFDLGCLFSMASQDSFSSDFVEAIILDVSRHLDDSRLAHSGRRRGGVGPGMNLDSSAEIGLDVMRFAIFCLCSLSSWSLGRRTLAGSDAAKKLVHILSSSDDLLVLEFTALVLGNCSSEPQGSSVVVLGAPTLCRMLKSRRFCVLMSWAYLCFGHACSLQAACSLQHSQKGLPLSISTTRLPCSHMPSAYFYLFLCLSTVLICGAMRLLLSAISRSTAIMRV